MEQQYKIVYSRRITKELMKRGFFPVKKGINPDFEQYDCWLFEDTNEFHKVFEELTVKKDR